MSAHKANTSRTAGLSAVTPRKIRMDFNLFKLSSFRLKELISLDTLYSPWNEVTALNCLWRKPFPAQRFERESRKISFITLMLAFANALVMFSCKGFIFLTLFTLLLLAKNIHWYGKKAAGKFHWNKYNWKLLSFFFFLHRVVPMMISGKRVCE